ncbi:chemotaxis protein CheW [Paenibacillus antibioticophila]|uniref:Chemotaxis protein CheW n=1 Tax=Paenibacillus antibioticophila TaxID=1274374 RepID=A0A919XPW1_9BACL|nr:chemotaxis protein CheW [Paenibacillus antibioticophila]GIO36799.1 chemotaxis protein CheW [Paenibacillus antibioticophila]
MQSTDQEQYIEFCVDSENYAITISEIHEIIKMQAITDIPNSYSYVQGVINLRGKIVPVISLRSLFMLEPDEYTKATRIVVANHKEEAVGIIVDKVSKVTTFSDIQPPPDKIAQVSGSFFTGIGLASDGSLVGILKLDEVLLGDS